MMGPSLPRITRHWRHHFHALMPYRVREILLVSSAYDAYLLEEDGPLGAQLFSGYHDLNLTWVPRITHVPTAAAAMQLLARRPFQLVLTAGRVEDATAEDFSRQVKESYANMPVVLLVFDEGQANERTVNPECAHIDHQLLWTGDANILLAAIKLVEDELNVEHDVAAAGVQVMMIVEDDLRQYSRFLSMMYPILMVQSRSLIAEGLNEWHRWMRVRARPKILLARNYEQATFLHQRWRKNMLAVITDVRFPRQRTEDPTAGIRLARKIRDAGDDTPILIQSNERNLEETARELDAWCVAKSAAEFPTRVRHFLKEMLGFGEFVFSLRDGTEVGRAHNIYEMEQALRTVPTESIIWHGHRHDFSLWLKARCMFQIAEHVRSADVDDFEDPEALRTYLLKLLEHARFHEQEGVVTDFSVSKGDATTRFVRLGGGSIGGKGRGIGFVSSMLVRENLVLRYPELEVRIPKTVAIGTDAFDAVVASIDTDDFESLDDSEIRERLLSCEFPSFLEADLRAAHRRLKGPIAVRSSSLLEDSRFQPFAGVYDTFMLPNNHPDPAVRFQELCSAIKSVYASVFVRDARTYMAGLPHSRDEEKMAVVIQQVVGQRHGERFYPHISGVAQSYNYYPIGAQKAEDGIAVIALGLGHIIVGGTGGLRFSPASPAILPQFPDATAVMRFTQRKFYALDLSNPIVNLTGPPEECAFGLDAAEADGTLAVAGSVYSAGDDVIRDNLSLEGPRVVTFNNILKWNAIPLGQALSKLLRVLGNGAGSDIELEFAVDMADWGRSVPRGQPTRTPRLYVLQVRPMARPEHEALAVDLDAFSAESILCRSDHSLGHGFINDIQDVVYVRRRDVTSAETRQIAKEVQGLNRELKGSGRRYLLFGPGRWGTSDPSLGVPVEWFDIAGARTIVETPLTEFVESSQGTHFFHNVTSARVGYVTATPEANGHVDWAWLDNQRSSYESELVRHVRLEQPITVHLDGRAGRTVILKPELAGD